MGFKGFKKGRHENLKTPFLRVLVGLYYFPFVHEYRINKRKARRIGEYKAKAKVAEIETIMAIGQRDSYRKRSEGLEEQVGVLEESRRDLKQQYEEEQTARIQAERTNTELAKSLKGYVVRNVALRKESEGLRKYAIFKDARVKELENEFQNYLASFFELPQFKKIPIVIVRKSGGVLYQSPASKEREGDLQGRNLEKIAIECSEPLKIENIIINNKRYDCYVFPLIGRRSADYSAIYLNPISLLQGVRDRITGIDAKYIEAFNEIRVGLARLGKQLGMENNQENQLQTNSHPQS